MSIIINLCKLLFSRVNLLAFLMPSNNSPAENIELKDLLSQLQNLINNSALSETAKQKALSKTQEIAEVSKKPQAEQKNLIEKNLGYFDGLSDSLESGTEIALKLGETIAKIALLFSI